MIKEFLKSTCEGSAIINGNRMTFIILEDNSCLIEPSSVYTFFGKTKKGRTKGFSDSKISFLHTVFFKKQLNEYDKKLLLPILYKNSEDKVREGFSIALIQKVITIFTSGIDIPKSQLRLYEKCVELREQMLYQNLQHLIYKELKHSFNTEKRRILEGLSNYVHTDLMELVSVIPIQFYIELFRLNNWSFKASEIVKRPSVIAKWVSVLILDPLKKQLLTGFKKTTYVQSHLEINTNHRCLDLQLVKLITLMTISQSMKDMWQYLNMSKQSSFTILQPPFLFDDTGCTIEPIENSFLSDFNLKLKRALEYNPNKNK